MARRSSSEIVVIMWRDIPAQVNGRDGDAKHQAMLPHRFQKAIDRAAMVAGKKTAQEYVAEWRRTSHPVTGDLAGIADMKRHLAKHVRPEFLPQIRGTTDSEWIYALFVSQLPDPAGTASRDEVFAALEEGLKAKYPNIRFVSWKEFGSVHGAEWPEVLASLPRRFRELGVEAAIAAMGC